MAVNDSVAVSTAGLADAGTLVIDGSSTGTGAAVITELAGTVSGDVRRETDPDGDGTFEVATTIQSLGSGFHSQGNDLLVSQAQNTRLVIENTSGGPGDFAAVGYEVDN